jgi:hypothetical protein
VAIDEAAVWARLTSAELRAQELTRLTPSDPADERHRLAQELFFHLGGAIEFMAQLAADRRGVGSPESTTIANIGDQLRGDALEPTLRALYANPRQARFPADPYDDDGYLWRIFNYRHQVTHRGANPFHFNVQLVDSLSSAATPPPPHVTTHLLLDPLDPTRGPSREPLDADLNKMLELVRRRITAAMNAL